MLGVVWGANRSKMDRVSQEPLHGGKQDVKSLLLLEPADVEDVKDVGGAAIGRSGSHRRGIRGTRSIIDHMQFHSWKTVRHGDGAFMPADAYQRIGEEREHPFHNRIGSATRRGHIHDKSPCMRTIHNLGTPERPQQSE